MYGFMVPSLEHSECGVQSGTMEPGSFLVCPIYTILFQLLLLITPVLFSDFRCTAITLKPFCSHQTVHIVRSYSIVFPVGFWMVGQSQSNFIGPNRANRSYLVPFNVLRVYCTSVFYTILSYIIKLYLGRLSF